jgi:hypothetical protein
MTGKKPKFNKMLCVLFVFLLLGSTLLVMSPKAEASTGRANFYILQLTGVPAANVGNMSAIAQGAIDASKLKDTQINKNLPRAHPKEIINYNYTPYYEMTPTIVSSWSQYVNIILGPPGSTIVNTHGEYLPVPSGYTKEQWVDKIAYAMAFNRLIWVHISGYTFYYVWYQDTGDGGSWITNGIGAGFNKTMSSIGLVNIDLWPPSGQDTVYQPISDLSQISTYWQWDPQYVKGEMSRPLKQSDVQQYLVHIPLFDPFLWGGVYYLPSASIIFGNASSQSGGNGCGGYVHIGSFSLHDVNGNEPPNMEYLKGFLGAAEAQYFEPMIFGSKSDGKQAGISPDLMQKASMAVRPIMTGTILEQDAQHPETNNATVGLIFAIDGISQSPEQYGILIDHWRLSIPAMTGDWQDLAMMANLDYSREASPNVVQQFLNLFNSSNYPYGLITNGLMLGAGVAFGSNPIAQSILLGLGGAQLFGQWLDMAASGEHGVNHYDSQIAFNKGNVPCFSTSKNGIFYTQFSTLVYVRLRINVTSHLGWQTIHLPYYVYGVWNGWYYGQDPGPVMVSDTLDIEVRCGDMGNPYRSQNDCGLGRDAGDTILNNVSRSFPCFDGAYIGGEDHEDWYRFYVGSSSFPTVHVWMTPRPYVNLDVDVINPNNVIYQSRNGPGATDGGVYAKVIGFWYVRVFNATNYDSGVYVLDFDFERNGGGCPYVWVWNGSSFVKDNNILPASEIGNGTDTNDYYKLEQSLAPIFRTQQISAYSIQISEFENERDYIDQIKLLSVDHSQDVNIAVTQEGEIITYRTPSSPLACIDSNNNSRLHEISQMDGNVSDLATFFQGNNDDWLIMNFGNLTSPRANLILRDDQKCEDVCINVQVPDSSGSWQTVDVLHPRSFWSMEAVNMTAYIPANGNFTVRLYWTAPHRLDYVGLDISEQAPTQVNSVSPTLAIHSTMGIVTSRLLHDDENCVELVNGQQLGMMFILPNQQTSRRDFILFANGYYYRIA